MSGAGVGSAALEFVLNKTLASFVAASSWPHCFQRPPRSKESAVEFCRLRAGSVKQ